MLFSSFLFLFWFLPAALLLYFALPPLVWRISGGRMGARGLLFLRNVILLFLSLVFYGWGEPLYVFLMIATVAANFLFGLWVAVSRRPKAVLWLAIVFNLGLLFYFKYAAFFFGIFGISIPSPRMPIGISFYTFQALSYVADVYFGRVRPEQSAASFGAYVSLFPQLIAGPIVRYSDVAGELRERRHGVSDAAAGARRFIAGLCKKVVLANPAGALFHTLAARSVGTLSLSGAWLALLSFSLQIYFDFSGYSDMAVGLGRIFGFRFPENFRYPYTAVSFTDFWRRWHITLSSFFKEYVYIPLGGSRRGMWRTVINLFAVWLLTGLWHGAGWNFVLWGLYYFLFLVLEKFALSRVLAATPKACRHALTLLGILFGWLLFAFDGSEIYLTFPRLGTFLAALLGKNGAVLQNDLFDLVRHLPFLLIAALGCTPLPRAAFAKICKKRGTFGVILPILGLLLSICYLADSSFNPFLYFRF
ncbi:MAG: MBOAT family protein [Clostridia bacterium]|nr:MBOAT family protein [Clostridia bacterium]